MHLESLRSAASKDGVGPFFDREEYNGRTILVRFTWTHSGGSSCRWEQAFSPDEGKTWEVNWTMEVLARLTEHMLWRRLDVPGHELVLLETLCGGWKLSGTAIFGDSNNPAKLD